MQTVPSALLFFFHVLPRALLPFGFVQVFCFLFFLFLFFGWSFLVLCWVVVSVGRETRPPLRDDAAALTDRVQ